MAAGSSRRTGRRESKLFDRKTDAVTCARCRPDATAPSSWSNMRGRRIRWIPNEDEVLARCVEENPRRSRVMVEADRNWSSVT